MKSVEGGAHGDPAAAEHAGTTELKRPVEYTALLAVLIRPGSKAARQWSGAAEVIPTAAANSRAQALETHFTRHDKRY